MLMLFVPISVDKAAIVQASLDRFSSDDGYNIPLAIPTTNKINPIPQEELKNESLENMVSILK